MIIGVIDSGIGGLTTLRELMHTISAEYYYYMDNANVPYGDKGETELLGYADNMVGELIAKGVDIIVIACNTLSAVAGQYLRSRYSIPIVCIEPSVGPARHASGHTLVIGTPNTIASTKFRRLISRYDDVDVVASHTLAGLIENGYINEAKSELNRILAGGIYDNIVLGCTHYVYMREYIESMGYRVFEGNRGVSKRTLHIAKDHGYIDTKKPSSVHIHSSKCVDISRITMYLSIPVMLW